MNLKFLNPRVIVQSIINAIDISNRANRELGVVQSITDNVTVDGEVDVSDNAYRELGVVQSITDTVNTQLTGSNAAVHESLTVDNTVGGVGFTGHAANIYALITCETAQVRFTVNGTAPTTTVGHLLNPGDTLKLDSNEDITAFRAIRTGSVSGVLKATFAGVA